MTDTIAVLGATGPIGRRVTGELVARGHAVRVVSRSEARLARDFADLDVDRHAADLEDPEAARRAVEGCGRVIHAVGLPAERFERHVPVARRVVDACRSTGARPFLVTSYWSYGPGDEAPMRETRPPKGKGEKSVIRRRQEAVFLEAGGAVARLPDFFGPEPGLSLLNDALAAVAAGKVATWPGNPDAPRDFLYYPDAGRLVADLALREEAGGEAWNVPGSGAEPPRAILERATRVAGTRRARVRRIRPWMTRLVALVRRDVREFLDLVPIYEAPVILDASKLERLLGEVTTTPYEEAIPETLTWMADRER